MFYSTNGNFIRFPLVRFSDKLTLEIKPYEWKVHKRNAMGEMKIVASRKQIPLSIGHAFSYHRIQGITLERAIVNCKGYLISEEKAVFVFLTEFL